MRNEFRRSNDKESSSTVRTPPATPPAVASIAPAVAPLATDCEMSVFNKVCRLFPPAVVPTPKWPMPATPELAFKTSASSMASIRDGWVKVKMEDDDDDDDDTEMLEEEDRDPLLEVEEPEDVAAAAWLMPPVDVDVANCEAAIVSRFNAADCVKSCNFLICCKNNN